MKAAVIGTGFIAIRHHLPAWQRLKPDVELAAVCDIEPASAAAAAERFGAAASYDDCTELLDREQPDFVDRFTPPASHADIAVKALEHGAAVLIEKPLALGPAECQRIVDAESNSDGRVEVAHTDLFNPVVVEAHRRIARGDIGEISGMRLLYVTPTSLYAADPDHFANRLPGGLIGETGPHVLYLSQSFIGPLKQSWVRASKVLPQYPWSPYDDYRIELLGERVSCSAVLTYTLDHGGYLVDIWGPDGVLRLDMQSKLLVHHKRSNTSPLGIGTSNLRDVAQVFKGTVGNAFNYLSGRLASPHERTIRSFVQRTIEGLPPMVSAADGMENCRQSADLAAQIDSASG